MLAVAGGVVGRGQLEQLIPSLPRTESFGTPSPSLLHSFLTPSNISILDPSVRQLIYSERELPKFPEIYDFNT